MRGLHPFVGHLPLPSTYISVPSIRQLLRTLIASIFSSA
jgi:hypothetical protein